MRQDELFAYLAAFVTIVLAVALTDMVQSVHRLLRARDRVKWDPLILLFALNIFAVLLSEFFGLWSAARFERLTYYGLVAFMAMPTLVALAAFAVLPDDVPKRGLDLRAFYFENRGYVAVLLFLAMALEYARFIRGLALNNALHSAEIWWSFIPMASANVLLLVMIYLSKRWPVQLFSQLGLLLLVHLSYARWAIEPLPAI